MQTTLYRGMTAALLGALLLPSTVFAAPQYSNFEVSGWIPYWRTEAGVNDAIKNIDSFQEVNPFGYTVKEDGTLHDAANMSRAEWELLHIASRYKNKRFIPTVMWSNGQAIHDVLSSPAARRAHINQIVNIVHENGYDGIDIDYEAKFAETKPYFSLFLKELYAAMGQKWVMCTIEARTPLDSRYESPADIPADIAYANDFKEINKYCDRVRIMTYDQGRFDVKLNSANASQPHYVPVSDVAWVEKVINLAAQDISKRKLVIGIPTYGYEHDMFVGTNGKTQYSQLWAFNPRYATDLAAKLGVTPMRNSAGEMSFTYPATQSPDGIVPLPNATRVMSWSDAGAIQQKIDLAKRLGVRGVAIFKIDGGQDPGLWAALSSHLAAQ